MNVFDFFWFLLILSFLQPLMQKKMQEYAREKVLKHLEQARGTRVIALVHREEMLSFLGFPLFRFIDMKDSESLLRAIRLTASDVPIDIVLHSPGGMTLAAEQIALALTRHKSKVTAFIPHYAMSGCALIALAADEIVMTENSVLGAVDPQIDQYPAASILKVIETKPIEKIEDKTLVLADQSRKAVEQMRAAVEEILLKRMPEEKAKDIALLFTSGTWTMDYPISFTELKEIGLPVSCAMPVEVHQLMSLYPQAGYGRPSVDYNPVPYSLPAKPN